MLKRGDALAFTRPFVRRSRGLWAAAVCAAATAGTVPPAIAADDITPAEESATLIEITNLDEISPPLIDPTGVTYIPDQTALVIADSEIDEEPTLFEGFNLVTVEITSKITTAGLTPDPSARLEPTGLAYDAAERRLFITNDSTDELSIVEAGSDGVYGTSDDLVTVPDYSSLELTDLEDVAFDSEDGHLLLLDGADQSVYRITPGGDGEFDGTRPNGDDGVSLISLPAVGILDATGLEHVDSTQSILVTDRQREAVFEVSANGNLVRQIDLSFLDVPAANLALSDVAIGPASDGSGLRRLYVVDRGDDNGDPNDGLPPPRDGRLIELSVEIGGGRFTDDDESVFQEDIEWLADEGITAGCNPPVNDRYCPDDPVTRGQMAAFLARALGLVTGAGSDTFTDDDGSLFEADVDRVASAGIMRGCNPPANDRACADELVTRGQMAAFLVRSFGYTESDGDLFADDDSSVFENDINKLATVGVTRGCNPPANDRFCPDQAVTRGQMAAFLRRTLES